MYVTVHRGTQQIGGSLIEVGTEKTRLLFDAGTNLPPLDGKNEEDHFQLKGLTCGTPAFDAILISHHHNDHCGLLKRTLPEIPVYTGEKTQQVLEVISDFINQPRPKIQANFKDGVSYSIGDFAVTPVSVEHSAEDAYMFLIQAEGRNVLYTGDFRAAENVLNRIQTLLNGAPLNLLISEGTNIRRRPINVEDSVKWDEDTIQQKAAEKMRNCSGTVFVLCSSTNEDRIQAITRAAKETGRQICEDLFQTSVRETQSGEIQRFVASYVDEYKTPRTYTYFKRYFTKMELVGAKTLAEKSWKQVIFVRASMRRFLSKYLKNCSEGENHLLIYSMWNGYKASRYTKQFLDFCVQRGMEVIDLHCSGHAYRETIQALIEGLAPAALLPIHCDKSDRAEFLELHPNCWMLKDGERQEIVV